ncbi:MAG: Gfo/Idh/MocA family oxidoreductase [Chloroflexota bacterium]|nr:Gfo/Idh/MocA family oxidoreductase [Chloroflexota bacterium]
MKQSRLGLCVIGCGAYAAEFAGSLGKVRHDIDLHFASRDLRKAEAYTRRFGGRSYFGGYVEAAESDEVDALYVCTPHHLHREHCRLGAENGKHVLVEKPLAHTVEDAAAIIRDAESLGITLMVAENIRYFSQVRRCKRLVSEGAIGDLRLINFQEEYPFRAGGWRSQERLNGGGVIIDGGIHKFHFMRFLAGEPDSVFATELPKSMTGQEGEDGMVATLRWSNGTVGVINHSWTSGKPLPPAVQVAGSSGRISFEVGSGQLTVESGSSERTWRFPPDNRGIPAMVQEFIECVAESREPEISGREGLKDLILVKTAYKSARSGEVENVRYLEHP